MEGSPLLKRTACVVCVTLLLAIAGCDGGDEPTEPREGPAHAMPRDAALALSVKLPEGDQRERVDALLADVAGPALSVDGTVTRAADYALQSMGSTATYVDDVEPWIGDDVGFYMRPYGRRVTGGMIMEIKRPERARRSISQLVGDRPERLRRRGVTIHASSKDGVSTAIAGDLLMIGTGPLEVQGMIDARATGEALAGQPGFRAATSRTGAPNGMNVARLYLDTARLGRLENSGAAAEFVRLIGVDKPFGVALALGERTVTATLNEPRDAVRVLGTTASPPPPLGEVPRDAWAVVNAPIAAAVRGELAGQRRGLPSTLDALVRRELGLDTRRDLLPGLGDAKAYIRGTTPRDFGFRIEARVRGFDQIKGPMQRMERHIERTRGLRNTVEIFPGTIGITVTPGNAKYGRLSVDITGEPGNDHADLVADFGESGHSNVRVPQDLTSTQRYRRAKEAAGSELGLYVDGVTLASFLRSSVDPGIARAVGAFEYLAYGRRPVGDRVIERYALGIKDPPPLPDEAQETAQGRPPSWAAGG